MSFHDRGTTWFLAQLRPNSVKIAERNLKRQGFCTFLPVEEVTRRVKSKFVTSERPMFPGYIFVAFDISKGGWQVINSTTGIARLVSFGKNPALVPFDVISGLMLRCDAGLKPMQSKMLSAGDGVTITSGPFADFVAEVEKIEPGRRVWALLEVMGGKTRVVLDEGRVRLI